VIELGGNILKTEIIMACTSSLADVVLLQFASKKSVNVKNG